MTATERGAPSPGPRPRVLLIGGSDVDARIDLMQALHDEFEPMAAGSMRALAPRFAAAGFPYAAVPLARRVNPVADARALASLYRLCRAWRPRIVHAFDTKPGVLGCLAARLAGVPAVIGTVTGLGSLYGNDALATRVVRAAYAHLQRRACRASALTIFQNAEDARFFVARRITPAGRVRIVPGSGVRTDVFDPARVPAAERARRRRELGIGPGEVVVTMVSRVIRSKGVLEFARAAARVRAEHPAVRFLLVGPDDPDSLDRLTAAEARELRDAVTWPGPTGDVRTVLALSDVFALPSAYREGVPRVLLEAAAMALPIVTAAMPGCSAVVEDGTNGFLVPPGDARALAAALGSLVASPVRRARLGAASRQRAAEHFDLGVIAARTRSLYREALADGAGGAARAPGPPGSRALDVCLAGIALLGTWPLILTGAVAVKLTSPGPMLYRARRAGLHGRPFAMLKLRTMRSGSDRPDRRITDIDDPRVTPVGRVLRRLKIDELPQLWNVLRGDMAMVGPRPEECEIVARHYTPAQRRVLAVRPGIASPVDVDWYPDLTYHDPPPPGVPIQEHYLRRHLPLQVAEALRYLERRTVLTDLGVIGRAAVCVLVRAWRPPPRRVLPLPSGTGAAPGRIGAAARAVPCPFPEEDRP